MSERLHIDVVSAEDTWSNEYGEYQAYMLDVKTEDGRIVGNVKSNRKIKDDGSHNEPHEGEDVWGTLESQKGGTFKLTLDTKRMKDEPLSQGAQFPSSESSTSNTSSPKQETDWEVRNAEIRRQHSQEMAVRVAAQYQETLHPDGFKDALREWADFFDADAIAAGQKASAGTDVRTTGHEGDIDLSGARTEEPGPDTHQWLEALLVVAGASTYASQKLATYALEKLLPEQRKTLETELNDPDSSIKAAGLKRVEASYEKTEGHAVPQIDPSDDIPF